MNEIYRVPPSTREVGQRLGGDYVVLSVEDQLIENLRAAIVDLNNDNGIKLTRFEIGRLMGRQEAAAEALAVVQAGNGYTGDGAAAQRLINAHTAALREEQS